MKNLSISFLLILMSIPVFSQEVKVVFDVTSADTKIHQSTMRHVKMMSNNYPDSEFEVVVYSGALAMMLKEQSTVKNVVEEVLENDNVSFKVCAMTLDRKEMDQSDLIDGVGTVPDGIIEIISKQNEGWGYIKEAN